MTDICALLFTGIFCWGGEVEGFHYMYCMFLDPMYCSGPVVDCSICFCFQH